jgi:single-strand DNA-binding protein
VDVTCWGKTAENASKYIKKGSLVYLGGRLKYDHWEDKTTGQTRTKISVVAENVQFLDGRSATQSGDQSQPATQASVAGTAWSEPDFEEPPF